jgi:predicted secreted acid phosphatase
VRIATKCAPRVLGAIRAAEARSQGSQGSQKDKGDKPPVHKPLVCCFDIDDTIIGDKDDDGVRLPETIELFNVLVREGVRVVLITARSRSAENERWTREQLARHGIAGYADLQLAPEKFRRTMADVSKWKLATRQAAARAAGAPVILSVGDAWSDLVQLRDDDDFDVLDDSLVAHAAQAGLAPERAQWAIVRPNDGLSLWGVKLKSNPLD